MNLKHGVGASASVVEPGQPMPKGGGYYHLGTPYVVAGRTYVPVSNPHYSVVGLASWYGSEFHGRHTANGEIFDENAISAAHPTLPLPCYVRVTNLGNQKSIVVRVNDRGPFAGSRIIDLSRKAAQVLGFFGQGLAKVKVDYVGPAPLVGSEDSKLIHSLREGAPAQLPVQTASNESAAPDDVDSHSPSGKAVSVLSGYADDSIEPRPESGSNIPMTARGLY